MGAAPTLNEVVEKIVREWPEWSRAERRKMDEIVEEVLDHCRNGTGNPFVAAWCRQNINGRDRLAEWLMGLEPFPKQRTAR